MCVSHNLIFPQTATVSICWTWSVYVWQRSYPFASGSEVPACYRTRDSWSAADAPEEKRYQSKWHLRLQDLNYFRLIFLLSLMLMKCYPSSSPLREGDPFLTLIKRGMSVGEVTGEERAWMRVVYGFKWDFQKTSSQRLMRGKKGFGELQKNLLRVNKDFLL